ncbi:hypothetical protein IQ06DRAFT_96373 [Phaeosphaeriaceae sp. SRC1lsM3a]|nr:hypothetical protein IQ06DRAFT_96373 [Stagonospora sp. SRC1lsM3a]
MDECSNNVQQETNVTHTTSSPHTPTLPVSTSDSSYLLTFTSLLPPPGLTPTFTETSTPHCFDSSSAIFAASCCSVSAASVSLVPTSARLEPSLESSVESLRRLSMEVMVVKLNNQGVVGIESELYLVLM